VTAESQLLGQLNAIRGAQGLATRYFENSDGLWGDRHTLKIWQHDYLTDEIDALRALAGLSAWPWTYSPTGRHYWDFVEEMRKALGLVFPLSTPWPYGGYYYGAGGARTEEGYYGYLAVYSNPYAHATTTDKGKTFHAFYDAGESLLSDKMLKRFFALAMFQSLRTAPGESPTVSFTSSYRLNALSPAGGPPYSPETWFTEMVPASSPYVITGPYPEDVGDAFFAPVDYTTEFQTLIVPEDGITVGIEPMSFTDFGYVGMVSYIPLLWMPYETP